MHPCDKTFHMVPRDLDLEVWPTFGKLNHGFYLVMVAAQRASE